MTEEERLAAEQAAREAEEAAAAEAAAAAEKAAKDKKEEKPGNEVSTSDADLAALQAELAELKKKHAQFDGIDPAVARENAKKLAAAETAAREAEKAKATAEGNFERLKQLQDEETAAEIAAAKAEAEEAKAAAKSAVAEANRVRVGAAFAASRFVAEKTVLSPAKAERLFSDHVAIEDGQVVVYDKPAGEDKRVKLIDSKGNPLPFDQAIQKVIESDVDKDLLIRSTVKPGAKSKPSDETVDTTKSRQERLAAGVAKLRGS